VILSAAMLLRHVGEAAAAAAVERAVAEALAEPANRTRDLGGSADLDRATAAVIERLEAA
jgi:tartrate dehydrogenase/decarboxylase/D-malate dehydrogenase